MNGDAAPNGSEHLNMPEGAPTGEQKQAERHEWSARARQKFERLDAHMRSLDRQYFISSHGGQVKVVRYQDEQLKPVEMDFFSFEAFRQWTSHQKVMVPSYVKDEEIFNEVQAGEYWLAKHCDQRQRYRQIGCFPEGAGSGVWNTWRGFGVEAKRGSWRRMRRHIWKVLARKDKALFRYIMRWCAWMVQNPHRRAEVVLVLRGEKGSGKGTLGVVLATMTAPHSWHVSDPNQFLGRFNEHLRDTVFLFADEAFWAGDVKAEGQLKRIVTEPTLTIEGKFKPLGAARNMLHILIASNADWVVPVSGQERRYVVVDVSDAQVGDRGYFRALYAELDSGGREAMLWDLEHMQLGSWHPREVVVTDAMLEQKLHSESNPEAVVRQLLRDGVLPNGSWPLEPNEAHKDCVADKVSCKPGMERHVQTKLGSIMKRLGAKSQRRRFMGHRVRWWELPKLAVARQRFDPQATWPGDSENPQEWSTEGRFVSTPPAGWDAAAPEDDD